MEKRWLQFFVVVIIAYGLMLWSMAKNRPPETQDNISQTAVVEQVGDSIPDQPRSTRTLTESPDGDSNPDAPAGTPSTRRFENRDEAPTVIVNTGLAQVKFSQMGALPTSWQILPSEFVAPVQDNDTGTTAVIDLIPQTESISVRSLPLELGGSNLSEFNDVHFDYEEMDGDNIKIIKFTSDVHNGIQLTKTYTLHTDTFVTELDIEVTNGELRNVFGSGREGWGIGWQGGLLQPIPQSRLSGQLYSIAAVGEEVRLKLLDEDDEPLIYENDIAWAGQEKKYFTALLIPHPDNKANMVEMSVNKRDMSKEYLVKGVPAPMSITLHHESFQLDAGESKTLKYSIFAGPKDYGLLQQSQVPMIAEAPPLTEVAFGKMPLGQNWIRPISLLLLKSLRFFENLVHNWGLAIILLVLTVKILLYPLSHWAIKNQAKTMAEQTKIRPLIEKINEKYKKDPQKKTQETMKLFREHKINPLGAVRGCFPMLLQMPIFFGLYVALDQAVELRGQDFLWVHNLAAPDRLLPFGFSLPLLGWDALNILPILMAVTQFFTTKMMSSNISDPTQRQIMTLMPIMFIFILYQMPAGLMLYWTVQNIWQIGHTYLTKRYVATHDDDPKGGNSAVVQTKKATA